MHVMYEQKIVCRAELILLDLTVPSQFVFMFIFMCSQH